MYLPEHEDIHNWDDAVKAFLTERRSGLKLIIFEDEQNDAMEQCRAAFHSGKGGMRNLVFCSISRSSKHTDRNNIEANYLTITDVCKCFPAYAKQDAVRLQALTGGIPAILKELDSEADYEKNVQKLLSYDSAFSTLLPQWLKDCFRSPESYYPILKSISFGHHRLSEIAKEIGFPNNKCGKYLEALIEHDFVRADKPHDGKYSTYHIANSYFAAWCRYVYGKKQQQIMTPDALFDFVGRLVIIFRKRFDRAVFVIRYIVKFGHINALYVRNFSQKFVLFCATFFHFAINVYDVYHHLLTLAEHKKVHKVGKWLGVIRARSAGAD